MDATVRAAFESWVALWEEWANTHREISAANETYERLAQVARDLEQQDDEQELVLATGLVTLVGGDGRRVRRHLLTERVVPTIDGRRSAVTVIRAGNPIQVEHRELFEELEGYESDRADVAAGELLAGGEPHPLHAEARVADCLATCVGLRPSIVQHDLPVREPGPVLELSHSPALVLRPRSQVALAEAYRTIGKTLDADEDAISVGLAQLVVETEAEQRLSWIDRQGGKRGLDLGEDPLFPLPTNDEQRLVMDLLRRETSVVVQGPPGTGKTHTIANLIAALLAQGQRVLVTSQKEQALRVLREKIPEPLRPLCVLLAGGNRSASEEVQNGLEALSNQLANADTSTLAAKSDRLQDKRQSLKNESARLNREIRDQRIIEQVAFPPSESGLVDRYDGKLGDIVRQLKAEEPSLGWIPSASQRLPQAPPISPQELLELHRLHSSALAHRSRGGRWVPDPDYIPTETAFAELLELERRLTAEGQVGESPIARHLAVLTEDVLARAREQAPVAQRLVDLQSNDQSGDGGWIGRTAQDLFSDSRVAIWEHLLEVTSRFTAADAVTAQTVVEMTGAAAPEDQGRAQQALDSGQALLDFLEAGGRLKKRFAAPEQRNAGEFLAWMLVNGAAPNDQKTVEAAVAGLRTELSALAAIEAWRSIDASVPGSGIARRADLQDKEQRLRQLFALADLRRSIHGVLAGEINDAGVALSASVSMGNLAELGNVLSTADAAMVRQSTEATRANLIDPLERLRAQGRREAVCHEVTELLAAVDARDVERYDRGRQALVGAANDVAYAARHSALLGRLRAVHPELADLLDSSAGDPVWSERAAAFERAWEWGRARSFVEGKRNAEAERELNKRYTATENELQRTTEQLSATLAMARCLDRLTDDQSRALKEFGVNQGKMGAGTGRRAKRLRPAVLDSMRKAMPAVPAWVVPLPNLLDNLPVERDSFDVVIVDEASQVGMENLFLLWLAPRVIVVGDDKQCSPGPGRLGKVEQVFARLDQYLGDVGPGTRALFTAENNLYNVLTARSGRNSVVRLREHFRCMPEIINYSSKQFYEEGLIPLRERTAADLDPLRLEFVEDGYIEGRDARVFNQPEAEHIAKTIRACLDDPSYAKRTFGVVVLRSSAKRHVQVLEAEINKVVTTEEREERKIRVGVSADFQGDERDVIMLSMVDVGVPPAVRALSYQQSYNVAASRARDQMWLFTSLRKQDLKDDLRGSLVGYMSDPPSVFGSSPALDEVGEDDPTAGFDSLLEQRMFREIRRRGYHVVPQYPVGTRHLDLVVVGADGQRLAVECDGDYWHSSTEQTDADARRDRELGRMGWQVVRVRESEFELDRHRAMQPVWQALESRGIQPHAAPDVLHDGWSPVELPDEEQAAEPEHVQ